MATQNNGGPAFPCPTGTDGGSLYDGMSLRDWFAGMALSAICSKPGWLISQDAPVIARQSYEAADAMLAVRTKPL